MAAGVRVLGLRTAIRSLESLGVEVSDLKAAFSKIGNIVSQEAKGLTPTLTGRLAASIRASKTKNKSVIRAGGAATKYAGVIHWGNYHNITGTYYLTRAVDNKEDEVVSTMDKELARLISQLGLK